MSRQISEILDHKGTDVVTVTPERSLREVVALLDDHGIGALVVTRDGIAVDGVVSERDVVRALARSGAAALDATVEDVMTTEVATCTRPTSIDTVMQTMTESRFRHMPVVEDGRLLGIISIGDVVKSRIDELEVRADNLESYVTGSSY